MRVGGRRLHEVEQLSVLRADYDEKLKLFKPDYPLMREMAARIERLNRTIMEERARASGDKHADLQSAFASARDAEGALAQRVNAAKNEVQSERSRMIQYSILQREVDTNRSLYDALLQRYKEIGVAGGIGESNISLVDPADAPNGPYSPRLPVNLALGLANRMVPMLPMQFRFATVSGPNLQLML